MSSDSVQHTRWIVLACFPILAVLLKLKHKTSEQYTSLIFKIHIFFKDFPFNGNRNQA